MPKFALHTVSEILGRIVIFKLSVDDIILYDDFEDQIMKDGNLGKELFKLQSILQQYAQTKSLPETKFRELKGCADAYTEFEIKTKNLRLYLFKEEKTGSIIVVGGNKNAQKKDISRFRGLKKAYIQSKEKS
jgi:putative component of toxin-antitoxin plasmid stabilization module